MNLSLSLHNFPDRGSLHNFPNRGCLMSIWVGGAGIGVASGAGRWRLETGGSGAITHASRRAVKPFLTRPFLTTWRRTRAWTGSNQARLTNICSVSSDACSVPSVHLAVSLGLARLQSKGKVNDRRSCRRPAYQRPSPLTKSRECPHSTLFFLGGRLMPTRFQAERRKARTVRHGSEPFFCILLARIARLEGRPPEPVGARSARPDLI